MTEEQIVETLSWLAEQAKAKRLYGIGAFLHAAAMITIMGDDVAAGYAKNVLVDFSPTLKEINEKRN